jgi:nucleoid-associated protein YgaU
MTSNILGLSEKQHAHTQVSLRQPLRCGFTVLLCSCLLLGAAECRAQETRDVAEAARQERTRKEQPKKQKHVYTEEDLGRAKILTPDDEARFAAQRRQPLASPDLQIQDPLDASTDLPQLPLGDVARRYRDAKRATQAPAPFHLPFDEPAFAAPVISIPNVAPPRPHFSTVHPSLAPSHSHAVAAPAISNLEPLRRIDPFTRRSASSAPSSLESVRPIAPATQPSVSRPTPVLVDPQPSAGAPSSPLHTIKVQPGDSLWKLALQNLGHGSRWHELLAANPGIVDPNRLTAGTEIIVPAQITALKSDVKVNVQQGDTLSKIAHVTYGRADAWRCIARANPAITDVNRIYVGQQLLLPFSCQP